MTPRVRKVSLALSAILLAAGVSSAAEAGWYGGHPGWNRDCCGHAYFGMSFYDPGYAVAPVPAYYPPPPPQAYYPPPEMVAPPPTGPVTDTNDGRYCREYQRPIIIGNHTEQSYGTACMQPDGSWQVQN